MMSEEGIAVHPEVSDYEKRLKRDCKEDIKVAIELAFEVRERLLELHPFALDAFIKLVA